MPFFSARVLSTFQCLNLSEMLEMKSSGGGRFKQITAGTDVQKTPLHQALVLHFLAL